MGVSNYIPVCDALVLLMEPLVEVVIHDIEKNKIFYINGTLSKRRVGDDSLLDKEGLDIKKQTYSKINFDGRVLKSISVIIEEKYLLCINYDISLFNKMKKMSEIVLNVADKPKALFSNDWQEKLHVVIQSYLEDKSLLFNNLSQNNKKDLIQHLFDLGVFNEKNAADYISKILNMGRATIFKYLKEWRKK